MKSMRQPIKFAHELCDWYRVYRRDLPFRENPDPYHILVSELMLQQTQMDTVIPYYKRFIAQFPNVATLAAASPESVLKAWEGLGYYRRARYLHQAAQTIMHKHNGVFPKTVSALKQLPGIGNYTAGAIASIAFDLPVPAVDGNVIRVMSRVLAESCDFSQRKNVQQLERLLEQLIQHEAPSIFTQALMELGALVCQKKPRCAHCPVNAHCLAFANNETMRYPNLPTKAPKTKLSYYVFLIGNPEQGYVFQKRPESGLLAGLLQLPQYTGPLQTARNQLEEDLDISIEKTESLFSVRHVFTHIVWDMQVIRTIITDKSSLTLHTLSHLPGTLSKAHRKILDRLEK